MIVLKKVLSFVLAIVMLLSMFTAMPIMANAAVNDIPIRWNGRKIEFIEKAGVTKYGYSVDIYNPDGSLFGRNPYVQLSKVGNTYQSEDGKKCDYDSKTGIVTTWEVLSPGYTLAYKYYVCWINYGEGSSPLNWDNYSFSERVSGNDLVLGYKGGFWPLKGRATVTGAANAGSTLWANFSDSSDPKVPTGAVKYIWQRSLSGSNMWSDYATGMSYTVKTADKNYDFRLKVKASDYEGYVLSDEIEIVKKPCETALVKAEVGYDGSNIVVTNAKKAQKYFVLNSKEYDEAYIENSWKDAKQPSADGRLTLTPAARGNVNYVYTKVAETDTHFASVDYAVSDVYCGGGSATQGVKVEYENLSRSQSEPARVGDVLKVTASCMPSSTTDWTGVSGNAWTSSKGGITFYTSAACASTLSHSTRYTVVYAKLTAQKNENEIKASFTNVSGTLLTGGVKLNVADTSGKFLPEDIIIPDMPEIYAGTIVKIVPFLTVPANASLENIAFNNGYSGLQVTIDKTNNTLTFNASKTAVGTYNRQLRRNTTTLSTKTFDVVENTIPIEDLAFSTHSFVLTPGTAWTTYFTLNTYPENANFNSVTFTSSDTNLVTVKKGSVTKDGVVYCTADITATGNATGGEMVTITAQANGKKASFIVTFSGGGLPVHIHSYDFSQVIKPTANTLGYTRHTCYCSEYVDDSFTAPTGKVAGFKCAARTQAAEKFVWNKVSGVSGYQIQISNAAGNAWGKAYATKANYYLFKGLTAGANYKFRIRTYIKAADGKNYFGPWVAIASPALPASTVLTKLTAGNKSFTAQWGRKAVTGYQIQYGTKANFAGAKTLTVKNAKAYKYAVKSLKAKTYYYVRIRTYKTINKANYPSVWSKTYKVKTK